MGKNGSNAGLKREGSGVEGRGSGDCAVMSIAGTATIRCKGCWRTTGRARFQADSGSSQSRSWSRRKINLLEFFLFAKEEEEAELGDTHTHTYIERENSLNVTNRHRDREGAQCPPTLQPRASGATAAAAVEVMRKQGERRGGVGWRGESRMAACTAAFGVFLDCWRRSVELQDYCVGAVAAREAGEEG